ncbi:MAG: carboxypeptidase-like regulatory domain-containing protein [Sphingobacterium sp.]
MMRLLVSVFFVYLSNQVFAQQLTGLVVDQTTNSPIINAKVMTSSHGTFTSATGGFSLDNVPFGDTITVSHMGYQTYYVERRNSTKSDTMLIILESTPIALQEVIITGTRNYTQDSLNRRKEYAAVFADKSPRFKDIFISKSANTSSRYSPFQNSTASLVSVNLLSVIGLLTKNKRPVSRLQKRLLKEEEYNYVDRVFSKGKVQSLTPLRGDSLQSFINEYRPSIEELEHMTDYDLILHIKESYKEFTKTYKHENFPSLNK